MSNERDRGGNLSRRRLLRGVGAGLAAGALGDVGSATGQGGGPPGGGPGEQPRDRYNVGIRPGHGERGVRAAERAADSVRKTIDFEDLGPVVNGRFSPQAREALENNPHVEFVERDGTFHTGGESLPWGIDRIGADQLYTVDTIGTEHEATVAVIDSGIDSDHPDLQHSNITGKAFGTTCGGQQGVDCCPNDQGTCSGYNGNECHEDWDDDRNHGTHVAGTIAADDDGEGVRGVVPGVDLLAAKVIDGCDDASGSDVADAIRWSTEEGADVINMSLVGFGGSTMVRACHYAYDRNVVLVACAGNSGVCKDCVTGVGSISTTIAVSNMTQQETLNDDSSPGLAASTGAEVELTAPGTDVLSTIPPEGDGDGDGYARFFGCSMATPHVAGVAALVKDITSLSNNDEIRARLRESAENVDLTPDDQGYGLVNALEATNSILRDSVPDRPQLSPDHFSFDISDTWFEFSFGAEYSDPVVVAGPASLEGPDPTTVRVRNVTEDSAQIRLQEWDYLEPGDHVFEEVSVAVFEAAHLVELNGAQAETGHVFEMGTDWRTVSFKDPFPDGTTPVVIPQVVTENGDDAVTVRLRNVEEDSFDVRLQEQESKDVVDEGHPYRERVDYLAVAPHANFDSEADTTLETVDDSVSIVSLSLFDNPPDLFAQIQTFNGADPCTLRTVDRDASGFDITVDEEQSADDETTHANPEKVGYVALEQFDDESLTYETGTGEIDQPDDDTWHPVRASAGNAFFDPVVLMGPPTHNGDQPTTIRVRNIGASAYGPRSFEFQFDEWEYLDPQSHVTEKISYGIFEAGTGTIGPANVEAGYRADVDTDWTFVTFDPDVFSDPPVVLTQCTSQSGDDPVTVRTRFVSRVGFFVRLQEEEANGGHVTERVDYLAIEPVVDDDVEAGTTGEVVDEEPPTRVRNVFDEFRRPPDLLASMQTFNGRDPATARFTGWGANSFGVFVEEEQSADDEVEHNFENVGYVAFERDEAEQIPRETGTVTGDTSWRRVSTGLTNDPVVVMGPPTYNDEDPTTVRVRNHEIDGFEFTLDEWDYLELFHPDEDVSYAVFEGGVGTIDAGGNARAEAGAVAADEHWEEVRFSLTAGFEYDPVVIPQVGSDAGGDAVVPRIRNVTTDGFEVRLQEQESKGSHVRERIDYIAAEPVSARNLWVDTVSDVDDTGTFVNLPGIGTKPDLLAGIQTFNGGDPCNLRVRNVTSSGFEVFVDEEQSADDETVHPDAEKVGYIAFER